MKEEWRSIAGHICYEVSNLGHVRSLPRIASNGQAWPGKVLKTSGHTYPMVGLSKGTVIDCYVHRLVLEAFVGPCPPKHEACHNNGNPRDNHLSNLRWDTRSANARDTIKHGQRRTVRGEAHYFSKLTSRVVRAIRRNKSLSQRALGKKYGVCHSTIQLVQQRAGWKHVK